MKFEPKSENEISSANLWPAGEYDFEVQTAEEGKSTAGNEMVKMSVFIFDAEGQRRTVFDYLVSTPGGAYKIRHFAEAVGLIGEYERGELLADDMTGRTGRCKVNVQKDKTGQYPDKNGIADYMVAKVKSPSHPSSTPYAKVAAGGGMGADLDDDIPFAACWQ